MLSLPDYVAARVALATMYLDTSDRRFLRAYYALKRVMLQQRQFEMIPVLLRRQA
jgi:hypothetical protein